MNNRITAGQSILENTATNTIFIADKLTEETQCTGENRNHIQKVGDLDIPVIGLTQEYGKILGEEAMGLMEIVGMMKNYQ